MPIKSLGLLCVDRAWQEHGKMSGNCLWVAYQEDRLEADAFCTNVGAGLCRLLGVPHITEPPHILFVEALHRAAVVVIGIVGAAECADCQQKLHGIDIPWHSSM